MKPKAFLKRNDIFGQKIEISDMHQTVLGGVASLLLRLVMVVYVVTLLRVMLTHQNDKTYKHTYSIAMEEEGGFITNRILYENTGVILYFSLYYFDQNGFQRNLPYDESTRRYIKVDYGQKKTDFMESDESNYFEYNLTKAKPCEEEDFLKANKFRQHDAKIADIYANWQGFTFMCPNASYELENTDANAQYQSMVFQVSKCRSDELVDGDLPCAEEEAIENFTSRLFVETWASYLTVDFYLHDQDPIQRSEKWLASDLLDPKHLQKKIFHI